jgi:hypothetical protein
MLISISLPILREPLSFEIGTMARPQLQEALRNADVQLNDLAMILFDDPIFDCPEPETPTVVEHSLIELGLEDGAVLSRIFQAGHENGFDLCPPTTGPYLRMMMQAQRTAPDAVMSNGQARSGSLTIASPPLQPDAANPKGFYLRVVDGKHWLRGYRCDDEHTWDPQNRFVFRSTHAPTKSVPVEIAM